VLLKNGHSFNNKHLFVPSHDKVLLSNICSTDLLLSILVVAAVKSKHYHQFLSNVINKTTKFVLKIISNKPCKEIYRNIIYLLALHFINRTKLLKILRYLL
jgi:hypothetical protein